MLFSRYKCYELSASAAAAEKYESYERYSVIPRYPSVSYLFLFIICYCVYLLFFFLILHRFLNVNYHFSNIQILICF